MPGARKLALVAAQAVLLVLALGGPPPAGAAGNGGALVVGDSIEVLTIPYLKRYLPPDVPLTTNAVAGYNSNQIYRLFEQSYDPSHSVIVFGAGTNDNPAYPQILAANLAQVAARIGDRCMVVPTIHGLTVDGIDNRGKNRAVRSFAASRLGTQVPDWAGAIAAQPGLLQSDDLHPTPAGADYRAQLIAAGIEGCLAFSHAAAPETRLESPPELPRARRFARREAAIVGAIARSLGGVLAARMARRQPGLATVLLLAATDA